MNNILVVNVNWLGDAIFSTPVFKAIKKNYPQARVSCLCVPRVKEVLAHCPDIDEIIVYDEKGRHRTPWGFLSLIIQISRRRFDVAFCLHRSFTRSLIVYLAGITQRVGYSKTPWLLTHPVAFIDEGRHRSDLYLKVIEARGLSVDDRRCTLQVVGGFPSPLWGGLGRGAMAPGQEGPYVVFNTGGNWDLKLWPNDYWVDLTKRASTKGVRVIFSGSLKDKERCNRIIEASGVEAINLAGTTTLSEALLLYKNARALVSGDSGPLHLAASVGTNVIGIFGPTRPEITGPRGSGKAIILFNDVGCNKAPCYHLSCPHNVCMHSISAENVWKTLEQFIH